MSQYFSGVFLYRLWKKEESGMSSLQKSSKMTDYEFLRGKIMGFIFVVPPQAPLSTEIYSKSS